jgi:hypothetical protein
MKPKIVFLKAKIRICTRDKLEKKMGENSICGFLLAETTGN